MHQEPSGQAPHVAWLTTKAFACVNTKLPVADITTLLGWLRFTSAPKPFELPAVPEPATTLTQPRKMSMRRTRWPACSATNTASPDIDTAMPIGLLNTAAAADPSANGALTPGLPARVSISRLGRRTRRMT